MYEILPHTADVRLRLVSADERSLFGDGAAAFRDLIGPAIEPGAGETVTLEVDAHDLTSLLVDFLNELVWLLSVRHLVPAAVDVIELGPNSLVASLSMDSATRWKRDVKAVTYHDAEVRLVDGAWTTTLVLDI